MPSQHLRPQSTYLQSNPQSNPQSSPQSNPQSNPQFSPQSNIGPIKASPPAPLREQFQEYPYSPQTHNNQTRKQRSDRSIETSPGRPPKRARLTKKNLKAFEKMEGQRRKDPKSEPNSSKPSALTESTSKTISTTDSRFPYLVFENGVLDPRHSAPPGNLDYLQNQLNRARDTESPTESEYQAFVYQIHAAPNEQTMLLKTSKLLKECEPGYRQVYNQTLSNFPKSVGFNTGLSAPQPDMIEGLDLSQFEPFRVYKELGGAAVPNLENDSTTLPHLAAEWIAEGKDMTQAQTQAAYDGAHMVYGRNRARLFLESPDPAGYAYVQTFTIDGTILNTFAHYSSEAQDQVEYHQYPTSSTFLIATYEDFKKSRQRLRNLQDDAKETSEKLRDELNEKWSANHQSPIALSIPAETADSTAANSYKYKNEEDLTNQLLAEHQHPTFVNATPLSTIAKSQNQESLTTQAEDSYMSGITHQELGSTMDRLRMDVNLAGKRPSGSL